MCTASYPDEIVCGSKRDIPDRFIGPGFFFGLFMAKYPQTATQRIPADNLHQPKEATMHLYWRIQQDLNCLGNMILFHDPALIRSMKIWIRKNYTGLAIAEGMFDGGWTEGCRN